MIQDIAPERLANEMAFLTPRPEDVLLVFRERTPQDPHRALLCRRGKDGGLEFPVYGDFPLAPQATYAFSIGGERYFLALPSEHAPAAPAGFAFEHAGGLVSAAPSEHALAAVTGLHLHLWYRDNQFCGHCGSRLSFSHAERALECRRCGNTVYPKIAPAVIVAVTDGDRLLLTRYADRPRKRRALVAGFVEIGETAEQAVQREVMEECGVRVKNVRYYKSQPWGIAQNLLLGYFAELDGDPQITLADGELSYAEWVPREEIDEQDDGVSLTAEMIARFKAGDTGGE